MTYTEYLQTDHWKKIRKWVLGFWDHKCSLCFSSRNVEVHHRTYERLYHELITDLIVLCDNCHERHHDGLGRSGAQTIQNVLEMIAV